MKKELKLKDNIKPFLYSVRKHPNAIQNYGIMNRPIGIVTKNYDYLRNALYKNIGDNKHEFDGYGNAIGSIYKIDYETTSPWFKLDKKKNSSTNYFEYIKNTYGKIDNQEVGVLRKIYFDNGNVITNPNTFSVDTKLGELGGFFLGKTINNVKIENKVRKNNSITENVYDYFGYYGHFGLQNGDLYLLDGRVRKQTELFDSNNIIPWSTSDNTYDSFVVGGGSKGNLNLVKNIFNLSSDDNLDLRYNDNAKEKHRDNLYYPFGNFYSITYSLGLTSSSGAKTKEYIAKSMLGYDLLGDDIIDIDLNNVDDVDTPKKYYVGNGTRGTNYIDSISGTDVKFVKFFDDYRENVVRMEFPDMGNDSLWSSRALYTYAEAEGNKTPEEASNIFETFNGGVEYGRHIVYNQVITSEKKDIVHYTNKRFQEGKYNTLISRFHTDEIGLDGSRGNRDITSTAISKYGMSHGRNLLKVKPTDEHGYNNPYCRTWTYHHQYSTLKDVIRPFDGTINKIEESGVELYRTISGSTKLSMYGAKHSNGLVRISPTSGETEDSTHGIKRCMFSIENLAWKGEKDFFKGHEDQKGPLGGRIMWFPPYDLKFSENVGVNWNASNFIGRGESIYTYTNTERSGNLSFKILIDHPSIVNQWKGEVRGGEGIGDVDDIHSNEQQLLRFFAGCELLKVAKPEEVNKPKAKVIKVKPKDPIVTSPLLDELVFYVFYPNNYSGVDDDAEGLVKPMEYLLNGIGANKYLTENNSIEDYGTQLNNRLYGYEMGNTNGISTKNVVNQTGITKETPLLTTDKNVKIAYQYCRTNKVGKSNFWGYRCDKAYENQVLHTYNGDTKYNYYDSKDYGLNNTSGYTKLTEIHTNDKEVANKGRLFSFADVFCAIQPDAKNILTSGKHYNEEKVNIISGILGLDKKGYNIVSIDVKGFASSHGYQTSNDVLGKNRANSVKKWLTSKYGRKFSNANFTYSTNEIGEKLSNYDSNSFTAKAWRCSRVAIVIEKEGVTNLSETYSGKDNITYSDNKTQNEINNARNVVEMTDARNKDDANTSYKNAYGKDMTKTQKNSIVNQIEINNANAEAEAMISKNSGNALNIETEGKQGYGNEYKFFSMLATNEPFLHSKIVEKLRYFDPAFHSITPEGFQSRLTFLHQCTRQGNTASASDSNNMNRTANNLAFGRPPICVLRIGDFYNTKIIMESLQIAYEDSMWDLNDEGIGVMPMMANVTIGFKFLGGSDLSGPINRLQNSLSFNYYANTSIYDDRAEEI